jgi:hypothetical protein
MRFEKSRRSSSNVLSMSKGLEEKGGVQDLPRIIEKFHEQRNKIQ